MPKIRITNAAMRALAELREGDAWADGITLPDPDGMITIDIDDEVDAGLQRIAAAIGAATVSEAILALYRSGGDGRKLAKMYPMPTVESIVAAERWIRETFIRDHPETTRAMTTVLRAASMAARSMARINALERLMMRAIVDSDEPRATIEIQCYAAHPDIPGDTPSWRIAASRDEDGAPEHDYSAETLEEVLDALRTAVGRGDV